VYGEWISGWADDRSGQALDPAERVRILDDIRRAYRHRGFEIEVL
jgi:hypothetical protein